VIFATGGNLTKGQHFMSGITAVTIATRAPHTLLIFLSALFIHPHSASAFEIEDQKYKNVIKIDSEITHETLDAFILESNAISHGTTVVVTSGVGGLLDPALKIGREIRRRGFATAVAVGVDCSSACTLIWFAGDPRYMTRFAFLNVHGVYVSDGEHFYKDKGGDDIVAEYLREMNVPEDIIYYISTPTPDTYLPLSPQIASRMSLSFDEY
jgi:hypothetical protein